MKPNKLLSVLLIVSLVISSFDVFTFITANAESFGGHYYTFYEDSMTWTDAKAACEAMGGHLVTINSEEEQKYLVELVKSSSKKNMWIGAKADSTGTYKWVTDEDFSYTNWASGEPNNVWNTQFTAMMYTQKASYPAGQWNDENENGRSWSGYYLSDFGYICEWESESEYALRHSALSYGSDIFISTGHSRSEYPQFWGDGLNEYVIYKNSNENDRTELSVYDVSTPVSITWHRDSWIGYDGGTSITGSKRYYLDQSLFQWIEYDAGGSYAADHCSEILVTSMCMYIYGQKKYYLGENYSNLGMVLNDCPHVDRGSHTDYIIYREAYRNNRIELALYDCYSLDSLIWGNNGKLELSNPTAYMNDKKFYIANGGWVQFQEGYERASNRCSQILASSRDVYYSNGSIAIKGEHVTYPPLSRGFNYNGREVALDSGWSISLFDGDNTVYNRDLAIAALCLSEDVYHGNDAIDRLQDMGFTNIGYTENYFSGGNWAKYKKPPMVFGSASYTSTDGSTKTVIAAAIQGTSDFSSLMTDIKDGGLNGFQDVSTTAYKYLKKYANSNGIDLTSENTEFFITGHSLGGATAGRLTLELEKHGATGKAFVYTYASANYHTDNRKASDFPYVYNIVNPQDIVPKIPPWTTRIGKEIAVDPSMHLEKISEITKKNTDDLIYDYYSKQRNSDIDSTYSGISQLGEKINAKKDLVIDRIKHNHYLYSYLACITSGLDPDAVPQTPEETGNAANLHTVKCPVDVKAYDQRGKLLAYSEHENVTICDPDAPIFFMVDGEDKYVVAPKYYPVYLEIVGTGSGTMEYSVETLTGEKNNSDKVSFENIAVAPGKTMAADTIEADIASEAKLYVTENNHIAAEINSNGAETSVENGKRIRPGFFDLSVNSMEISRMENEERSTALCGLSLATTDMYEAFEGDVKVLEYGILYGAKKQNILSFITRAEAGEDLTDPAVRRYQYACSETGVSRLYNTFRYRFNNIKFNKYRAVAAYIRYEYGGEIFEEFSPVSGATTIIGGYINGVGPTLEETDGLDD